MAEAVENAVRLWILTEREDQVILISQSIENASTSILELVKTLGPYLTSEENETRVKGCTLLVEVLGRLQEGSLSRQATRVLAAFLNTKVDTVDEVIPALKGLLQLSTMPTYTDSECKETVEQLFKLQMRAHVQSTRHLIFLLVDSFMSRHRSALQELGSTFVKGYISLVENEKDPRNLLLIFSLDRIVLLEFDISDFVEQFYDITFCYFPITFKAPPNDPYGVTGPELVAALRSCLSASPLLGPPGMHLLIEKLNVGTPTTKLDTLATVTSCLPVYGKVVADSTADKLWDGLKIEIFQPVDTEVQTVALMTVSELVKTCHPTGEIPDGIGRRILKTCLDHLQEPSTSQGQIAVKVVEALMRAADPPTYQLAGEVIPALLQSYEASQEPSNKTSILNALTTLISTQISLSASQATGQPAGADLPAQDKALLLALLVSSIQDATTANQGLKAMQQFIELTRLSEDELEYVIHNVTVACLSERTNASDNTSEVLPVLRKLAGLAPELVEKVALPPLFAMLPDEPLKEDDQEARSDCAYALSTLQDICQQSQLFSRLLVHLFTKVELLLRQPTSSATNNGLQTTIPYAQALLKSIYGALEIKSSRGDQDIPKYADRILPRLYALFLNEVSGDGRNATLNPILITSAANIISLIVASLPVERQKPWITALFDAFYHGRFNGLVSGHATLADLPQFRPLEVAEISIYDSLVPLFTAGILGLHPDTPLPSSDISEIQKNLLGTAVCTKDAMKRHTLGTVIGSILNKHANVFIDAVLPDFWERRIAKTEGDNEGRKGAISLWGSVCRGLVVRSHPSGMTLARQLFGLFDDEVVALHAAYTLGQIPNLQDAGLNKRNHAVIRLLYAQQFLNALIPQIVDGSSSGNSLAQATAYLTTISCLFSSVPRRVTSQLFGTLFSELLEGLELDDLELRANVVDAMVSAVEDKSTSAAEVITGHLGALISRMVRSLAVNRKSRGSTRLRIGCIHFLAGLAAAMKQEDIQPYRAEVLRELQRALDDPARKVRREAVLARSKWHKINPSPPN